MRETKKLVKLLLDKLAPKQKEEWVRAKDLKKLGLSQDQIRWRKAKYKDDLSVVKPFNSKHFLYKLPDFLCAV